MCVCSFLGLPLQERHLIVVSECCTSLIPYSSYHILFIYPQKQIDKISDKQRDSIFDDSVYTSLGEVS